MNLPLDWTHLISGLAHAFVRDPKRISDFAIPKRRELIVSEFYAHNWWRDRWLMICAQKEIPLYSSCSRLCCTKSNVKDTFNGPFFEKKYAVVFCNFGRYHFLKPLCFTLHLRGVTTECGTGHLTQPHLRSILSIVILWWNSKLIDGTRGGKFMF